MTDEELIDMRLACLQIAVEYGRDNAVADPIELAKKFYQYIIEKPTAVIVMLPDSVTIPTGFWCTGCEEFEIGSGVPGDGDNEAHHIRRVPRYPRQVDVGGNKVK